MDQKMKSNNTRRRILEVAAKLFLEKGFEKTSMRDIVDNLGMSKGAIYHQFKSKEEIMKAVYQMQDERIENQLHELSNDLNGKLGKEKIQTLIRDCLLQSEEQTDQKVDEYIKSAEYTIKYMKDNVDKNAPIIADMIKEGNKDGSLTCEYPEEMAEAFMLLVNIWCDPSIFKADQKRVLRKLRFIQGMMKSCGVDVLEDSVIDKLKNMDEGESDNEQNNR